MPTQKVWTNQVDGLYDVYVERSETDTHKGTLKVELKGEVILSKEVIISYGGPFGPDAGDVAEWQKACLAAVDEHLGKKSAVAEEPKKETPEPGGYRPDVSAWANNAPRENKKE